MISVESADAALIASDPQLPVLADVLHPGPLIAAMGWEFAEAQVRYVRYKKATSIVTGVELRLTDGTTRMVQAFGFGSEANGKLEKLARAGASDGAGRGVAMDLTRAVGVADATADRHLPGIRRFLDRHHAAQPLVYKPGKRWVGEHQGSSVKIYRPKLMTEMRIRHRAVAGMQVPQVVKFSARNGTVVSKWVPGTPLDRLEPFRIPHFTRLAGAMLAELHAQPTIPGLKVVSLPEELQAAIDALAAIAPQQVPVAQQLAQTLIAGLPPEALSLIHGDYSPDQVVAHTEASRLNGVGDVTLLDLDRVALDDPHADLGSWFGYGVLGGLITDVAQLDPLVEGYRAAGGRVDQTRLRLQCASGVLRRVAEPFRCRVADWDYAIGRLLDVVADLIRKA